MRGCHAHVRILLPLPLQLVSNWFWVAMTCKPDTVLVEERSGKGKSKSAECSLWMSHQDHRGGLFAPTDMVPDTEGDGKRPAAV